jgi:UDP-glucose 4-epimerase
MFTEDMAPKRMPRSGFAKDICEVEGYVRGFARRRPDVTVTMLRGAATLGPHIGSPMTHYFKLPVVPTVFGFDARLQFLHEDDLLAALRHACVSDVHGTFNVAGDGTMVLSQALRRLGRPSVPMPPVGLSSVGLLTRRARVADFNPEQISFLTFGRGVDTRRMRSVLGFEPRHTTESAFADFARTLSPGMLSQIRGTSLSSSSEGGGRRG